MKFKFFAINAGVDVIKIKEEPHWEIVNSKGMKHTIN
jgi:hypothetical protein